MSYYVDWFVADASEAESIASLASSDDHSFEDWPHLGLQGVADVPLTLLRGILRGKLGTALKVDGESLFFDEDPEDGGMVSVTQVLPAFMAELAALTTAQLKRAAVEWHGCEGMTDWSAADVARCLKEMAAFARRANRAGKPVLCLSTV